MIQFNKITPTDQKLALSLFLMFFLSITGCKDNTGTNDRTGNLDGQMSNAFARRFKLSQNDSCTILSIINPWQGADNIHQNYYLIKRGQSLNLSGIDSKMVIEVPIRNIVCTSTTHLAMIAALNEETTISGFSGTKYIYESKIYGLAESGNIRNIGDEAGLNYEQIISLEPDLIMVYGVDSEAAGYLNMFETSGIRLVFNADYLEEDPLGKAEWIKVFGALYCKDNLADSIFSAVADGYMKTKEFVSNNSVSRPSVLLGLPFRDTWYISPGNSYAARLIHDAGGSYLWADTESSFSMPQSLENVFAKSQNADYWLNPGSVTNMSEIKSFDVRLTELPCFLEGKIFNNNNRISKSGGNDYWEGGVLAPQIILRDIASILHPDLFSDYQLVYYKKVQ